MADEETICMQISQKLDSEEKKILGYFFFGKKTFFYLKIVKSVPVSVNARRQCPFEA